MKLTHLTLRNFRSYPSCSLDFESGVNLIEGVNGSGKSNLVEAIDYLSLGKSWRTSDDRALIRYGEAGASIEADVSESSLTRHIEIFLTPKGRKILVNGKPIHRLSELSKLINVVLFAPEDTGIFRGSPFDRRNFLDVNLSKQSLDYFALIGKHNRLLEERNAVLKSPKPDLTYLEVVTDGLIAVSEPLERYRRLYVDSLNKVLSSLESELYGHSRTLLIAYRPFIKAEAFQEEAKKAYKRALDGDLYHKVTSIGLQREDFTLLLDGKDVGLYGSQGENRLSAIALKLSPYFLIDDPEKKPLAILDDVYSELDVKHAARLTVLIQKLNQSFVTGTQLTIDGAHIIDVAPAKATRRI
jgi:DNA replication and repair protein RecF